MQGRIFGVGVGPGDPSLLTLKAVRILEEVGLLALPGKSRQECTAYQIARQAVPSLDEKEALFLPFPMVSGGQELQKSHEEAARLVKPYLDEGRSIAFLTLGDPCLYSTFSYLMRLLKAEGYEAELVNGIPSFLAAASRLGLSLAEGKEELHILPGALPEPELSGTYVILKGGKRLGAIAEGLEKTRRRVWAVKECGMEGEEVYEGLEELPEELPYLSLVIAKEIY